MFTKEWYHELGFFDGKFKSSSLKIPQIDNLQGKILRKLKFQFLRIIIGYSDNSYQFCYRSALRGWVRPSRKVLKQRGTWLGGVSAL